MNSTVQSVEEAIRWDLVQQHMGSSLDAMRAAGLSGREIHEVLTNVRIADSVRPRLALSVQDVRS